MIVDDFVTFTGTFEVDRDTDFTYDANDRILTKTVDDDTNAEDRHTVYDWDDNGTSSTTLLGETTYLSTDDQGTVETITTNEYNARGRLSQSEIDEDGNQTIETTTQFDYDNGGLRIRKTRTTGGNTETREFVFDPQSPTGFAQALEEVLVDLTDPLNPVRSVDKAYTVGLDVISQALANAVTGLAAKEPGTFIYDAHGSVRQIADEVGAAVQIALREVGGAATTKIDYEAYGEAINAAITTAITTLLYSGEFTDALTNQQYLRARFYDIGTGRFTRVDPFAGGFQIPQSLHKYLYSPADPITFDDPTGEAIFGVLLFALIFTTIVGSLLHVAASGAEQDLASANNLQASIWNVPEDFNAERLAHLDPESLEANLEFAGRLSNANNLVAYQSAHARANYIGMANAALAVAPMGGGPVKAAPRFIMGWHPGKADHLLDIIQGGANLFASGKYEVVATRRTLSTLLGKTVNSRSLPDISGVRNQGSRLVDIWERWSPSNGDKLLYSQQREVLFRRALGPEMGKFKLLEAGEKAQPLY